MNPTERICPNLGYVRFRLSVSYGPCLAGDSLHPGRRLPSTWGKSIRNRKGMPNETQFNLVSGASGTSFPKDSAGLQRHERATLLHSKAAWWLAGNSLGVGTRAGVPVLAGLRGGWRLSAPGRGGAHIRGVRLVLVFFWSGNDGRRIGRCGSWEFGHLRFMEPLLFSGLLGPCNDSYDCEALLAF